jgi:hypothetical protein
MASPSAAALANAGANEITRSEAVRRLLELGLGLEHVVEKLIGDNREAGKAAPTPRKR